MTKYYRVIKTVPGFDIGAILKSENNSGYQPINDFWDRFDGASDSMIAQRSIELKVNQEFFTRVYPIGNLANGVFGTKEQAQAASYALYQGDKE